MIQKQIHFPTHPTRPFFFTSFVSTIDGKIAVKKEGYWPIGSKNDYEYFTFLRAHADAIIDGKNTALQFGAKTIETMHSDHFASLRKKLGKQGIPAYIVLTNHPDDELRKGLHNEFGYEPTILSSSSLKDIGASFMQQGYKHVFLDGGPHLIGAFLSENMLDEVFLTLAPKIFGNSHEVLTMVEGKLFTPEEVKHATLLSCEKIADEVFLRYKMTT